MLLNKFCNWLSHPKLPFALCFIAVFLTIPSLWNGFNMDDNLHRLILTEEPRFAELPASPLNLFCFNDGNIEKNNRNYNLGIFPWWAIGTQLRAYFFRPISALTHCIDYFLWPDSPFMMHAQNLFWLGILTALAALLYRRIIGLSWVAGLAALLYAIDDAHGVPAGWLANRNSMIACTFAVLCLLFHDRWRKDELKHGYLVPALCLCLSLLSAEAGIAVTGYLLAYALFIDRGTVRTRFISLIPYAVVCICWSILYLVLGCGTQSIFIYTDPLREPIVYLQALFLRIPVYVFGQWAFPPVDVYFFLPTFMHRAGIAFILVLAFLLYPLLRWDRSARFWATGMLLSLIPICAVIPSDRNLLFFGLGTMALIAQGFSVLARTQKQASSRMLRIGARMLLFMIVLVHLIHAPLGFNQSSQSFAGLQNKIDNAAKSLPSRPITGNTRYISINTPHYLLFVHNVFWSRSLRGEFTLLQSLTSGDTPLTITRLDDKTLKIASSGDTSLTGLEMILISNRQYSTRKGQIFEQRDMKVEVLEIRDGLPVAALFCFTAPLEDTLFTWFCWEDEQYKPFTLPAIDETVNIQGAKVNWFN